MTGDFIAAVHRASLESIGLCEHFGRIIGDSVVCVRCGRVLA